MNYFQCKLRKGNIEKTAWIPEKFAKKGQYLKLKKDNGWEVIKVNRTKVDEKVVTKLARQFQGTRKVSDI